jgi:hypothetical protein
MILLACSGFDGPPEALVRSIEVANQHAAVAACLCLASFALFTVKPTWWVIPAISVVLFALHPAWTVSAIGGDCGFLKREAACAATGIGLAAICLQLGRIVWTWTFSKSVGRVEV